MSHEPGAVVPSASPSAQAVLPPALPRTLPRPLPPLEIALAALFSLLLIGLKAAEVFRLEWMETLAFVTGGVCVWLTVRENIWNWPIGIANSLFFAVVFWRSRLFADMALQGVYVALGFAGWYWWLHGGEKRSRLTVRHAPILELMAVVALTAFCTFYMERYLKSVNDAAPFWDALTTTISLAAQYLMTRKYLQSWFFWIAADVVYVPLYWSRELYLTSGLYSLFLCLCVAGLIQWRRTLVESLVESEAR